MLFHSVSVDRNMNRKIYLSIPKNMISSRVCMMLLLGYIGVYAFLHILFAISYLCGYSPIPVNYESRCWVVMCKRDTQVGSVSDTLSILLEGYPSLITHKENVSNLYGHSLCERYKTGIPYSCQYRTFGDNVSIVLLSEERSFWMRISSLTMIFIICFFLFVIVLCTRAILQFIREKKHLE